MAITSSQLATLRRRIENRQHFELLVDRAIWTFMIVAVSYIVVCFAFWFRGSAPPGGSTLVSVVIVFAPVLVLTLMSAGCLSLYNYEDERQMITILERGGPQTLSEVLFLLPGACKHCGGRDIQYRQSFREYEYDQDSRGTERVVEMRCLQCGADSLGCYRGNTDYYELLRSPGNAELTDVPWKQKEVELVPFLRGFLRVQDIPACSVPTADLPLMPVRRNAPLSPFCPSLEDQRILEEGRRGRQAHSTRHRAGSPRGTNVGVR
jgi:hypothetical protein